MRPSIKSDRDMAARLGLDRAALVGVSVIAAGISTGTLDRSQRGDDSSAGQKALRMLVVDDEALICFVLCSYFTARGFEVDCADSADKAEALLRGARYAVLISDLRLAGSDVMQSLDIVAHDEVSPGRAASC